ncbi:flap endonuclease-1 [archaeon]|jgi:flap endonuclease-1|nr:flap endonuclease-1 [archaeon]
MGLKIKEIVTKKPFDPKTLKDKILAVDSMNYLYQFLTTIRGPDGTPLTNSKGEVTSHLIGLFNRTTSLMEEGMKFVFVFDGKAPALKQVTWDKRDAVKKEASLRLEVAKDEGDLEAMRKFASRTTKLNKEMINDAKEVITLLGLPIVQAPSEGEAQASAMVADGTAYACISQDYDNLIFGCPKLIRNLTIAGRRKRTGKLGTVKVEAEELLLADNLGNLGITHEQLIYLAILVGTDYNPAGIKGIGQKKALKLIKENKGTIDELFKSLNWDEHYPDLRYQELFTTIKDMPTIKTPNLEWHDPNEDKLVECLVKRHGFSEDRVRSKLQRLQDAKKAKAQKGLGDWF